MINLAILSALALAQSGPPPKMVYFCPAHEETLATLGRVTMSKTFNADGTLHDMRVEAEIDPGPFLRRPDDRDDIQVSLKWPGDTFADTKGNDAPFGWSRGSVSVLYRPSASPGAERGKAEKWNQTIIDRGNGGVTVATIDGKPWLLPSMRGTYLATDPHEAIWPNSFAISLDDLLAWGTGVDDLTFYMVVMKRADDTGAKRIITSYRLNPLVLAASVAGVRAVVAAWETTVADYKTACKFEPESARDVIVT